MLKITGVTLVAIEDSDADPAMVRQCFVPLKGELSRAKSIDPVSDSFKVGLQRPAGFGSIDRPGLLTSGIMNAHLRPRFFDQELARCACCVTPASRGARRITARRYDLTDSVPIGKSLMKAIEIIGDIDDRHHLRADVPKELSSGQVRLIVLPEEDHSRGG